MIKPNMYHGYIPLCTNLQERELTHSELVRHSPCGWCGKKSIIRSRDYANNECTEVYVLATCKDHQDKLIEYSKEYMKKTGMSIVVNDWSDMLEDKERKNNEY